MISQKNYNFFMQADMSHYIDEWVAIVDERIVSHGKDAKRVFNKAKEICPKCRPVITKIPGKKTMIL